MTHQIHTRQSLESIKLADLKAIASQIGATPSDRRSKSAYIDAILVAQPQPLTSKPQTLESPKPQSEVSYDRLCMTVTGTNALHQLKDWCAARHLRQGEDFETLYRNILNCMTGYDYQKVKPLNLEIGCIDEAIKIAAETAEILCDELELEIFDLSLEYGDVVIPQGQDAYHVCYNDRLVLTVQAWNSGWYCPRSNGIVYDDPHNAIVGAYEHYNPEAVLLARAAVEANSEIGELVADYI